MVQAMSYNPRVHHRRSVRLAYDYTQAGAYFVTICTYRKECILHDSRIHRLLRRIWGRTVGRGHFPNAEDFVVMPNHVHGTVWIRPRQAISGTSVVGASRTRKQNDISRTDDVLPRDDRPGSMDGSPLRSGDAPSPRRGERGSLSAIVASFKAHAAIAINRARGTPGAAVWQRNYSEHIIRSEDDLRRIRESILDNPRRWDEDPENPVNAPWPMSYG